MFSADEPTADQLQTAYARTTDSMLQLATVVARGFEPGGALILNDLFDGHLFPELDASFYPETLAAAKAVAHLEAVKLINTTAFRTAVIATMQVLADSLRAQGAEGDRKAFAMIHGWAYEMYWGQVVDLLLEPAMYPAVAENFVEWAAKEIETGKQEYGL